jgi:hypothetical protein
MKESRGMRRSIRAGLAALTLTALFASPALAAKPVVQALEQSGTFTIACRSVTLVEAYTRSVQVTRWLDGDGHVTRGHARVRFDGTITAPGSTLRVSDVGRFTSFIDFGPDGPTVREAGMLYKFSAPGLGVVAHDVGVLRFLPDGSVEVKGPHDVWDNGVESLICPLFE